MKSRKISIGSLLFDAVIHIFAFFVLVITLYPFIYVLSMSVSDPLSVIRQEIWLLPKGFNLGTYKLVAENRMLWIAYYNTIWYAVIGTVLSMIFTLTMAYPLSQKSFILRRPMMLLTTFTMFFSGGMIPLFILVSKLKLYDTRWAIVLPALVSTWNLFVTRTFFEGIPESLIESCKLDGATDIQVFISIILPLSMPIVAVMGLFYAVGYWNSYFSALLYLPNVKLQPLQLFLMKILIQDAEILAGDTQLGLERSVQVSQLKYAAIVITALPIIMVYPFIQKHFVKGVMIGAIKA